MYKLIKYEVEENILTLTLNRPEMLNVFSDEMCDEIKDALDIADKDDEVKAIIITGAGRGFCAGQDLSQSGETFDYRKIDRDKHRDKGGTLTLRIYDCIKPIIAAINGPAVGIGITMTLPMDIRIASTKAKMGFVFVRRGILPEACSSWFLPRLVGISQALEWAYTGRVFTADEALAGGLVSRVVEPDELIPTVRKIAKEIAENSAPVSVSMTRQLFWKMLGEDHPYKAHRRDSMLMHWIGQQPDADEGIKSFLEKRKPVYKMKPSKDLPDFYPWWEKNE